MLGHISVGRPGCRLRARLLLGLAVVALLRAPAAAGIAAAAPPDYQRIYAQGVDFAAFLEKARARREEWRSRYRDAGVPVDVITRIRALPERRRILVVAEDWCSDSVNSVPYIARLVDAAPSRLTLHIVGTAAGASVMDANQTPDGRGATPTVIVLGEDGRLMGAWVERPAEAQRWFLEAQKTTMQKPLHEQLAKWYEDDGGRTTLAEVAAILER